MGQRGQIDDQRGAGHVLAEEDGNPHLLGVAVGLFHHLAEADDLPIVVGHFNAHGVLARQRGHDTHAGHAQGDGQIVGQAGDLAQPQSGLEFHLELGDDRTGLDFHHADIEAEVGKGLFQDFRLAADLLLLLLETDRLAF